MGTIRQYHQTPLETLTMQDLKILHLSVDDTGLESYYRVLVDGKYFKYISIDSGVYDVEDLTFPQALLSKLPNLPSGEWNLGHISKNEENTSPHFSWTLQRTFSGIQHTWHSVFVDYLSLTMVKMLLPNVYEATTPRFDGLVIVKFARFPWEIDYYDQETQAYSWIEGHDIGPVFLGHVTEGERVIGFLLQRVAGRHARPTDLQLCRTVVSNLHSLGIYHGDLNKHNFLIQPSRAYLIDFEASRKVSNQQLLISELNGLEREICSESKKGGNYSCFQRPQS
jgi:hypothetical protein